MHSTRTVDCLIAVVACVSKVPVPDDDRLSVISASVVGEYGTCFVRVG